MKNNEKKVTWAEFKKIRDPIVLEEDYVISPQHIGRIFVTWDPAYGNVYQPRYELEVQVVNGLCEKVYVPVKTLLPDFDKYGTFGYLFRRYCELKYPQPKYIIS